jgi:hypothetical protein
MRYFGLLAFVTVSLVPARALAADFNVQATFPTYTVNGQPNPTISVTRGQSYTLQIDSVGHPFDIKTVEGAGTANQYSGFSPQGVNSGLVTFSVPADAPSTLFYDCELHSSMAGTILVTSPGAPATGPVAAALLAGTLFAAGFVAYRRRRPA